VTSWLATQPAHVQRRLIAADRKAFEEQRWPAASNREAPNEDFIREQKLLDAKELADVKARAKLLCDCYVKLVKMGNSVFGSNTIGGNAHISRGRWQSDFSGTNDTTLDESQSAVFEVALRVKRWATAEWSAAEIEAIYKAAMEYKCNPYDGGPVPFALWVSDGREPDTKPKPQTWVAQMRSPSARRATQTAATFSHL